MQQHSTSTAESSWLASTAGWLAHVWVLPNLATQEDLHTLHCLAIQLGGGTHQPNVPDLRLQQAAGSSREECRAGRGGGEAGASRRALGALGLAVNAEHWPHRAAATSDTATPTHSPTRPPTHHT